ncbi:MAG: hypothetical protein JW891_18170, partial [Candidatus Lokiarchaeota archaeon]|nr:hypothetical protein [Candidatus Lokiarchaeota archaeon]
ENGTIDASEWGTFANGTLVTVSFFANDTLDNTCQEDIIVRKIVFYDEEASTDLPRNQILGFDMIAVLVGLGIISIITLHKNRNNLNEKI